MSCPRLKNPDTAAPPNAAAPPAWIVRSRAPMFSPESASVAVSSSSYKSKSRSSSGSGLVESPISSETVSGVLSIPVEVFTSDSNEGILLVSSSRTKSPLNSLAILVSGT